MRRLDRLRSDRRLLVAVGGRRVSGVRLHPIGFVGHEAGHHQISASRQANDIIGLVFGDLAIG
jgi:fatty acid desaturase